MVELCLTPRYSGFKFSLCADTQSLCFQALLPYGVSNLRRSHPALPIEPFLFLPLLQDGLLFLAEKLQGPFSFELAAQSIGVKISEGLMYLQENSVGVSAQVHGP